MKCPKCEAEMEKVVFQNIEVDRCTNCRGIWFDRLEHESLKQLKGSEDIDVGAPEKGKEFNRVDKINCPVCHTIMVRMVDAGQPHIWFEKCASCDGVFFDAGEFTDFKEHTLSDFIKDLMAKERK